MRRYVVAMMNKLGLNARLAIAFIGLAGLVQWGAYHTAAELRMTSIQQREVDKINSVSRIIEPEFKSEGDRAHLIAKLVLAQSGLANALRRKGKDRSAAIAEILDHIFKTSRIDVLEVTDEQGVILYRAHQPGRSGDIAPGWGVEEGLAGKVALVSRNETIGPTILSIEPISAGDKIIGTVSAGTRIDEKFIRDLRSKIGAELALISRTGELTASSSTGTLVPDALAVMEAFQQKIPIYRTNEATHTSFVYLPVLIVDDAWVIMTALDSTSAYALLKKGDAQAMFYALLGVAGSMLFTFYILKVALKPLQVLRRRADGIVKEITGGKETGTAGDEIVSLVKALDTLTDHLLESNRVLKESERLVKESQSIARLGSYVLDVPTGNWTSSAVLDDIFGIDDSYERSVSGWLSLIHPEWQDRMRRYFFDEVLEKHVRFDREYRIVRKADGEARWIYGLGELEFDAQGRLRRMIGTISDITERKQAEAEHAQLEAQLRESQKMEALGTLAGGVAHDFNNALAAITGNAELARQDVGPGHAALQSLEEINKAARRAKDLVQQILAFGRRQPLERKPTTLSLVVLEAARLVRATLPAGVTLDVDCKADTPAVLADASQIKQILLNLCANAIQASQDQVRPGVIEVGLGAHTQGEARGDLKPGHYARLTVRDNGAGMDEATRSRIFEPFFTTKPKGKGTGLGLSVVHGIVKTHEASIEVECTPGAGSEFHIYFSAIDAPIVAVAVPAVDTLPFNGQGKHILYVDDEEAVVFLMQRLLERQGYRVSGFTNPGEALAAARVDAAQFDLAVTDYNMPGISGLDVAIALKEIRADLPVILASGYITEELRAKAPAAGIRELIYKPDTVDDLCAAVARFANA